MNDVSHSPWRPADGNRQADCTRAGLLMLQAADDELVQEQTAWLNEHLRSCAACDAQQARFRQIDQDLGAYGELLWQQNPPRPDERPRFLDRMATSKRRKRSVIPWIAAAAGALAASIMIGVCLNHTPSPARNRSLTARTPLPHVKQSQTLAASSDAVAVSVNHGGARAPHLRRCAASHAKPQPEDETFIRIPFTAPLAPYERIQVVRKNMAVAALIAAGFEVRVPDTGAIVTADVLIGQDGRAHAIRIISSSISNNHGGSLSQ